MGFWMKALLGIGIVALIIAIYRVDMIPPAVAVLMVIGIGYMIYRVLTSASRDTE
jgi:hypothetical protein